MTPEEAYAEALRRIREAKKTGALELDLIGLATLNRLPRELARLTSLQSLYLHGCEQLSGDLAPLTGLTSLQWLSLSGCRQLSDLSPLVALTSLQRLRLDGCLGVRRFAPLESLLPTLKELSLFGCKLDDLPPEVCGGKPNENVLDKVRAHYADLQYGARRDAALKVFFLGNAGAGKTQLCRRLRRLKYDPKIPTTHGVQLGQTTVRLDGFPEPVRLNLWDFGGQDNLSRLTRTLPSWTCHLSRALDAGAGAPNHLPGRRTLFPSQPSFLLDRLPPRLCRDRGFRADCTKANAIRATNAYCIRPPQ